MKAEKILLSILFTCLYAAVSFSQCSNRTTGLFLTAADCRQQNIAYANTCKNDTVKIRLNDFTMSKYLTIVKDDGNTRLLKEQIFGYQRGDGVLFRFKKKRELRIINPFDSFVVYKVTSARPITGRTNVTPYYYSIGLGGEIKKLSKSNLITALANNKVFTDEIRNSFKYNTDLMRFDETSKKYRLLALLKQYGTGGTNMPAN